jgi:hypothetical protein
VPLLLVGLTAILLCGCSDQASLQTYTVGPAGHQVRISAAQSQHVGVAVSGGRSAGTSVISGAINYASSLALPSNGLVRVAISVPRIAIPAAHARWIINDFFNNTPERLTTWHGASADLGVRPCSTPAGPCTGYLGGIQVIRGGALYNVTVQAGSARTAWAVIDSFHLSPMSSPSAPGAGQ